MNFTYNVKITLMMRAEILKAPFNAFQVGREFVGDKSQEMHVVPTVPERWNIFALSTLFILILEYLCITRY